MAPSDSSFYFTNKEGTHVWKLLTVMTHDFEKPGADSLVCGNPGKVLAQDQRVDIMRAFIRLN